VRRDVARREGVASDDEVARVGAFSAAYPASSILAYLCAPRASERVNGLPGVSGSSGMKFACRVGSPHTIHRFTPG
jgi:hypothetical protein